MHGDMNMRRQISLEGLRGCVGSRRTDHDCMLRNGGDGDAGQSHACWQYDRGGRETAAVRADRGQRGKPQRRQIAAGWMPLAQKRRSRRHGGQRPARRVCLRLTRGGCARGRRHSSGEGIMGCQRRGGIKSCFQETCWASVSSGGAPHPSLSQTLRRGHKPSGPR